MVLGGFPVLSCSYPQRTRKIAKFGQILMISESEREIPCIFSLFSGNRRILAGKSVHWSTRFGHYADLKRIIGRKAAIGDASFSPAERVVARLPEPVLAAFPAGARSGCMPPVPAPTRGMWAGPCARLLRRL